MSSEIAASQSDQIAEMGIASHGLSFAVALLKSSRWRFAHGHLTNDPRCWMLSGEE
jgi:hypothetical protein